MHLTPVERVRKAHLDFKVSAEGTAAGTMFSCGEISCGDVMSGRHSSQVIRDLCIKTQGSSESLLII